MSKISLLTLTIIFLSTVLLPDSYFNLGVGKHVLIYGILSVGIIITSILLDNRNALDGLYRNRLICFFLLIGDASYSLYLIHGPLLSLIYKFFSAIHLIKWLNVNLIFMASLLICVSAAILFHLYIEKPVLRCCKAGIS